MRTILNHNRGKAMTIKAGQIILNTKKHACLVLKVDDRCCWLFAKTPKGYSCNCYIKWYIDDSLTRGIYKVIAEYPTWQEAVNDEALK